MRGTERYGEGEESLEECDWCGAKILPPPYAPHECRETEEEVGYGYGDIDGSDEENEQSRLTAIANHPYWLRTR